MMKKDIMVVLAITTRKHHGSFEEWLERKGHWLRAHPQMFRFVHDGRYFGKGGGEVWEPYDRLYTPPAWDINLMDGRYIAAVIDKEKIIFKGRNVGFDLKFAFCIELAYLLGAAHNFGDLVWYHSKSMDKLYKEPKPLIVEKGWSEYVICYKTHAGDTESYEVGDTFLHWSKDSSVTGYGGVKWKIYVEQDIPLKHQVRHLEKYCKINLGLQQYC